MDYKLALSALATCFALSACGGISSLDKLASAANNATSTPTSTSGSSTPIDAKAVDATYNDYLAKIGNGAMTTTSPTGQATMAGYMGISGINPNDATMTAMGRLNMNVNFDAGQVTGTASDFGIYNGAQLTNKVDTVTGSLNVAGTVSGSDLTANATGTLGDSTGTNSDFNLNMTGKFYDDAGTLTTVGDVSGTMSDPNSSTNVGGAFDATKN